MTTDTDYGKTIHLPKTDFPRRAGLATKEPKLQERWAKMDLYNRQRTESADKENFILHMGPPFANGNIHLGHVLSTVLKDVVCRSYQMLGYNAPLIPGFDCHGLPIEWKIEEQYRSKNQNKEDNPVEFRNACRDFAAHWVGVQSEEFKRLGILADWENPYLTMRKKSESLIAAEIHKFLRSGSLYRGSKPVMWSIPEQTALAEAEVEYRDMTSDTIWAAFKIANKPEWADTQIVIWTTTPWTLPGNRAIGYGEALNYVGIEVTDVEDESLTPLGKKYFICADLVDAFKKDALVTEVKEFWSGTGRDFEGVICHHPLHGQGYDFDIPMLAGDFVTNDGGTGFVHIAPGHGEDDYLLGLKHKIEVPQTVGGDGMYVEGLPLFEGLPVYTVDGKKGPANKMVMNAIQEAGNLVAKGQIRHSYPHSWRSKAPVIFRNTPQWFISMDENDLRQKALGEIEKTRFVPARGQNRIRSMVEGRGDWCVSRQRAWGVPIAIFVEKKTGQPLQDEKVLKNIIDIFEKEGSDAWFDHGAEYFLGADYNADDFEKINDIIDVWFESGSTQGFVLEERPELSWPADLYLEGSDQHRGWFQSSLLVGCGTRGGAPYKSVLTHGFILNEKGYKMSKSDKSSATSPAELMETNGADIIRLWVTGSDYTEDIKFGQNILKGHVDIYRRLRNTFCYLLGSMDGTGSDQNLSELDQYVLHRLYQIDQDVRQGIKDFDFQGVITTVHNFCARELSAFYFDICKDTLYCDALDSDKRRGVVYVLEQVFKYLCHWLSPVLVFTTEEAWLAYKGLGFDDVSESIHLSVLNEAPASWKNDELADTWEKIIAVRSVVTGALEIKRAEKEVKSSLEAAPIVYIVDQDLAQQAKDLGLADICITSDIDIRVETPPNDAHTLESVEGVGVVFAKAKGVKCDRCWKYTTDTGAVSGHDKTCARCGTAVNADQQSKAA